jgi:hypothetical protein
MAGDQQRIPRLSYHTSRRCLRWRRAASDCQPTDCCQRGSLDTERPGADRLSSIGAALDAGRLGSWKSVLVIASSGTDLASSQTGIEQIPSELPMPTRPTDA